MWNRAALAEDAWIDGALNKAKFEKPVSCLSPPDGSSVLKAVKVGSAAPKEWFVGVGVVSKAWVVGEVAKFVESGW